MSRVARSSASCVFGLVARIEFALTNRPDTSSRRRQAQHPRCLTARVQEATPRRAAEGRRPATHRGRAVACEWRSASGRETASSTYRPRISQASPERRFQAGQRAHTAPGLHNLQHLEQWRREPRRHRRQGLSRRRVRQGEGALRDGRRRCATRRLHGHGQPRRDVGRGGSPIIPRRPLPPHHDRESVLSSSFPSARHFTAVATEQCIAYRSGMSSG
jgi:hypothetical protein